MPLSSAVDASAVARVVGIKTEFKDLRGGSIVFLPQRVAVFGQGASNAVYSLTKQQLTTAYAVGQTYGFGSPLHLAAKQLLPANGDGVGTIPVTFYPMVDNPAGAFAVGGITPSNTATGVGTFRVKLGEVRSEPFATAAAMTVAVICDNIVAAINAVLDVPAIATDNTTSVGVSAKWKGVSGNSLKIEIIEDGANNSGVTFGMVQPTGGAANPSTATALAQIGNVWETMLLNCLDIADTTALDLYQAEGEGRWGPLRKKPFLVFTGNTAATVSAATAVSDARKTDRINAQLVSPGTNDLPFVVAARQLARIVTMANNNPPHDYGSLQATGLVPGADAVQWAYPDRDSAVKKGSSTVEVKDGVVNLSDIVTFYHPSGDPTPAYRYVCDIVKVWQVIFNLDLIFNNSEWDGAPLIPDDEPTVNRTAKQPKAAKAAICAMHDSLGLEAIISDVAYAKKNTFAAISAQNPKRLDVNTTVKISGNVSIISIDLAFGFYFGATPLVA